MEPCKRAHVEKISPDHRLFIYHKYTFMHIISERGGQYGCQNNIYPHFSLDKVEQTCSFRLGTVAVVDFFQQPSSITVCLSTSSGPGWIRIRNGLI